jgi:hypothetical protein
MSTRSYGNALAAGLLLIALGVIFLIENFHAPFSAWRLIERYWPLLIIAIGVKRMFEYILWPDPEDQPQGKE